MIGYRLPIIGLVLTQKGQWTIGILVLLASVTAYLVFFRYIEPRIFAKDDETRPQTDDNAPTHASAGVEERKRKLREELAKLKQHQ